MSLKCKIEFIICETLVLEKINISIKINIRYNCFLLSEEIHSGYNIRLSSISIICAFKWVYSNTKMKVYIYTWF